TLYALLSGRPPVEAGEMEEVLCRVQKGEIPPPRSLDPAIPRPLEAICLTAMALKPEDRYPSARALAEDVTRWLDDAPVSAYREPVPVRVGRWMRRHRTLATSAASVLVFGLIGLAGFASALAGKNQQLDAKNVELAGKNQELDRQRQRAEEREALAIDAVKKFRDAVTAHPELKKRPELAAIRKALLKEPLEFFRRLRDQFQADPSTQPFVRARLAGANIELAEITAEIGSFPDASLSYREASNILEPLVGDHPELRDALATAQGKFGMLLYIMNHVPEAQEVLKRSLEIWERLVREHPGVSQYQNDRAVVREAVRIAMGRPPEDKRGP